MYFTNLKENKIKTSYPPVLLFCGRFPIISPNCAAVATLVGKNLNLDCYVNIFKRSDIYNNDVVVHFMGGINSSKYLNANIYQADKKVHLNRSSFKTMQKYFNFKKGKIQTH